MADITSNAMPLVLAISPRHRQHRFVSRSQTAVAIRSIRSSVPRHPLVAGSIPRSWAVPLFSLPHTPLTLSTAIYSMSMAAYSPTSANSRRNKKMSRLIYEQRHFEPMFN